ncbi:UNVERIFIED_CONTAM: hypothetical protein K2H54_040945 [Gekko kuhli]
MAFDEQRNRVGCGEEPCKRHPSPPPRTPRGDGTAGKPQEKTAGAGQGPGESSLDLGATAAAGRPTSLSDSPCLRTYRCGFIGAERAAPTHPLRLDQQPSPRQRHTSSLTLFGDGYSWVDNTDYVVIA